MKKILPILLIGVFVVNGVGAAIIHDEITAVSIIQDEVRFSEPVFTDEDTYVSVEVKEATSYATLPGNPVLPVYTRLFMFPFGTTITDVTFTASPEQIITITKEINPADQPTPVSPTVTQELKKQRVKNERIYTGTDSYPSSRLRYQVGSGLNGNDHMVLVSVQYYPVLYTPQNHALLFTPSVQITIRTEPSKDAMQLPSNDTLLLIGPEEYRAALQPLIAHKNHYGIQTTLLTTEWIATHATGRDLPEQIKYAIKDAIEMNGTAFVLLVGGVDQVPIRRSYVELWGWDEETITDLYYSDVYDAFGGFSSWDTNSNNRFGEAADQVDHYPDVHLGRLACPSLDEVNITVDKIIHYETETYGSDWFNTMILVGGNTFRWSWGNDGEDNNKILMGIMSQFTPTIIWTSKHNFNRRTISNAISAGAGFFDYSGHGFEHGMATFTPSGLQMKYYFTRYTNDLTNGYKLPIMFFDACLTAKIDFILQDFLDYREYRIFDVMARLLGVNTSVRRTCYAWAFINHEGGGGIASIGATRTAYGGVDDGAGKMSIEFFSAYNSSQYLGEMMTQMQKEYITDVPDDSFTVEEFILLGDPSLKIGGYPPR
jgi:hypothetical protein